jgi:hypothetical protein
MTFLQLVALGLIGATTTSSMIAVGAEVAKLPSEANRLKQSYQQAVERGLKPIRGKYVAELNRLVEQFTRAGQLEEALAIKNEIAPGTNNVESDKLPDECKELKKFYRQAVDRDAEPLREKYISELNRLLEQSSRAGKLEDAIAIKAELDAAATLRFPASATNFKNSRWQWLNLGEPNSGKEWIEFHDDGIAKASWLAPLKWKIVDGDLLVEQGDGRKFRFYMDGTFKEGKTNPKEGGHENKMIRFLQLIN